MATAPKPYRIKITQADDCSTYIVRKGDNVSYISGDEIPLALSNLLHGGAAEVRFALEDALTGEQAVKVLRDHMQKQFARNMARCPMLVLLG